MLLFLVLFLFPFVFAVAVDAVLSNYSRWFSFCLAHYSLYCLELFMVLFLLLPFSLLVSLLPCLINLAGCFLLGPLLCLMLFSVLFSAAGCSALLVLVFVVAAVVVLSNKSRRLRLVHITTILLSLKPNLYSIFVPFPLLRPLLPLSSQTLDVNTSTTASSILLISASSASSPFSSHFFLLSFVVILGHVRELLPIYSIDFYTYVGFSRSFIPSLAFASALLGIC